MLREKANFKKINTVCFSLIYGTQIKLYICTYMHVFIYVFVGYRIKKGIIRGGGRYIKEDK